MVEQAALIQAWEQRDRSELAQIAHRILGASRYTGVPQLRQASQDLEDKCSLNVQHVTPAQFVMLKPYYDALLLALSDLKTLDLSPYPQLNYHRLSEDDMTWKMIWGVLWGQLSVTLAVNYCKSRVVISLLV